MTLRNNRSVIFYENRKIQNSNMKNHTKKPTNTAETRSQQNI